MMTLQELSDEVKKICLTQKGCVCLECMSCGDKIFFFEGLLEYLYKRYSHGCRVCGGEFKLYHYDGPGSEL